MQGPHDQVFRESRCCACRYLPTKKVARVHGKHLTITTYIWPVTPFTGTLPLARIPEQTKKTTRTGTPGASILEARSDLWNVGLHSLLVANHLAEEICTKIIFFLSLSGFPAQFIACLRRFSRENCEQHENQGAVNPVDA
jgi:hypothetical protein